MYTREEISKIKQAFWTAFGRYMQPVMSAEGLPVNWINYRTGVNGIHFKMDAEREYAEIMISLSNKRELLLSHYDQLLQLKAILEETLGEDDWIWQRPDADEHGKQTITISKGIADVNVLRESDWPAIISFLKPRLIALDEFWSMVKPSFEVL
ncbi:DUF4268 domain-containing protein [Pseudoflavitalea sp. G-6-1-2]|uniref:DUF4268 domain-containing protein n=1 Tax=Pseudoflavitalea sp. G-6-1-2 TaxID=2728841 RepID=UPI00146ACB4E|nr:DUF4268 domain-containing protein [Pseudoflavitalea sp. G-6-1-2]NML21692.1 DUF4268 domain-containing protein [Pseudoflavitalea sp. G-6-1-2]